MPDTSILLAQRKLEDEQNDIVMKMLTQSQMEDSDDVSIKSFIIYMPPSSQRYIPGWDLASSVNVLHGLRSLTTRLQSSVLLPPSRSPATSSLICLWFASTGAPKHS